MQKYKLSVNNLRKEMSVMLKRIKITSLLLVPVASLYQLLDLTVQTYWHASSNFMWKVGSLEQTAAGAW